MKKIIIGLLLCIPFISILLVVIFRGAIMPTNEEVVKKLRDINCYETNVEYIVNNGRGQERQQTKQYYTKQNGVRVEFGNDIVKVYKKDGIHVTDNISKQQYVSNKNMDVMHSVAFMNNILAYPAISDIKEGQEEWGDTVYIQLDVELFLDNKNLNTARIFIDKKLKEPIGIIVYDNKGNDTVRIIYKDFKKVKQIDDSLL